MGIDARSAERMVCLVGRDRADAGARLYYGAVFCIAGVPAMALPEAQKGRLVQIDPLRIGGPDAALLAPHSWRRWCS